MKTITVQIASYKKAQVFRKDYVRQNNNFVRFHKVSGNHSYASLELKTGDQFDARGSIYREGVTKWNAADCQSWAKFQYDGAKLTAHKFDGTEIPLPNWITITGGDECLEGDECRSLEA